MLDSMVASHVYFGQTVAALKASRAARHRTLFVAIKLYSVCLK